MKSWLLFPPPSIAAEDPLPSLHTVLQARLASRAVFRPNARPSLGQNLGVVRTAPPVPALAPETADRIADLRLEPLFDAMAGDDTFVRETARLLVPLALTSSGAIRYRQQTIRDGLRAPHAVQAMYRAVTDAVEAASDFSLTHQPGYAEAVPVSVKVGTASGLLALLLERCGHLRQMMGETEPVFQSNGFADLARQVNETLAPSFLREAGAHLETLSLLSRGGRLVIGATLGSGCKPHDCVLRGVLPPESREKDGIPLGNIALARSADEMRDAALTPVLRLVTRLSDTLIHFLERLRFELAFVAGACRLAGNLQAAGLPFCFPDPVDPMDASGSGTIGTHLLADGILALSGQATPVPNDLAPTDATLFLITGANQGGKSTFLRSFGLAQVMMQCGLFVTAASFRSRVYDGIYTHFAREEDPGMVHGRLEEELVRMDRILTRMTPRSLLLLNESFATTTERDGAIIASGLLLALHASGATLMYVTHLYECAAGLHAAGLPGAVFLRAQRSADGGRSFRILPGAPQPSSHALDLYDAVMRQPTEQGMRRSQ